MLPARSRLFRREDFARVFAHGQYAQTGAIALKWMANTKERSCFGLIAGKKHFPLAVKRNRAKRLLREAARFYLPQVSPGFILVVFYRFAPESLELKAIKPLLETLLRKNNLLKNK